MPTYSYQARDFGGKTVQGSLEAASEAEVRVQLRARKLVPLKVMAGSVQAASAPIQLSFGKPKVKSKVLSQTPRGKALDDALVKIVSDITEGKRLGDAFQAHPGVFSKFYINMLIAGEEGGVLDQVLSRLAAYIEKSVKLQGKIKGAMTYPIVVLFVAVAVVLGLLVFVIPKFVEIFKSSGQEIPYLTQVVMNMSNFVMEKWYILLGGFVLAFILFQTWANSPTGRRQLDAILVRVPVFGDFIIKGAMAKFSRTLSTLLTAGVSIIDALQISATTSGNSVIEDALIKSKQDVSKGKLLSLPLSQEPFIPHMVVQMIAVGEQTGALDNMLSKVADFYEDEVELMVSTITSLMEPIMIVVLGGIIAFFVVAMYLPIFNMAGGV